MIQAPTLPAASVGQVTVSVVSHGHGAMIDLLLADLATHCGTDISVILTYNIHEAAPLAATALPFPLKIIRNPSPKGFGANHNAAFRHCDNAYFCVLNPDIRLNENPFPALIGELVAPGAGVAAPRILNPAGEIEDSARRFPSVTILLRKLFSLATELDYEIGDFALSPDWVAGMFMLFRAPVFAEMRGFDERYFLYYEDVDLCRRLRKRGYEVRLIPAVSAVHDARRESHRSLRHMHWHLASILRYLLSR